MQFNRTRTGLRAVLATTLCLGVAGIPALASANDHDGPGNGNCGHQMGCKDPAQHRDDHRAPGQDPHKDAHRKDMHHDNGRDLPRIDRSHYRDLPPLPKGQSYRRDGDRVVRVDNSSGEIIAAIGLFAALTAIANSH